MVELVAEHGYDTVTMAMLTRQARVSKRDFYKQFAGKEECFLSTYDVIVGRSVGEILAAVETGGDWRARLRLGFDAFARQLAGNPEAARLALVDGFAVGSAAVDRMLHTNRLFEALVAKNLAPAGEAPRLPRLVVKGIVAGSGRIAQARLLSEDQPQAALDGEELIAWALSFYSESAARLRGLEVPGTPPPSPAAAAPLEEMPPGDERAMIMAATARLACSDGYSTLTVRRLRAAAGVSKRSFDANFDGVSDCCVATLEMLSGRTLATAEPSYLTADDWASGVHRMTVSLCQRLANDPGFAELAFLDVFSPDPEVVHWRSETISRLAAVLRRRARPPLQPTAFAAEASVGAMWGVIQHFVASGRGAQLPAAAPVLSYLALAPALGGSAAVDAIAVKVG